MPSGVPLAVLGFGLKDVTIEYSADGTTWTVLKAAQFARAPGQDGYAVGTTVDLAGTPAKFIRLTPKNNWGGLVQQFGLSEVRFYYIPVSPRQPVPAAGEDPPPPPPSHPAKAISDIMSTVINKWYFIT